MSWHGRTRSLGAAISFLDGIAMSNYTLEAEYYQQFDADLESTVPGEGYGGWQSARPDIARECGVTVSIAAKRGDTRCAHDLCSLSNAALDDFAKKVPVLRKQVGVGAEPGLVEVGKSIGSIAQAASRQMLTGIDLKGPSSVETATQAYDRLTEVKVYVRLALDPVRTVKTARRPRMNGRPSCRRAPHAC